MSISSVQTTTRSRVHHPRRHAAIRTDDYVFSQLIPYIGNKRKLLHLIGQAVRQTGCGDGTFVDLFTGSTVVARWAKQAGFRVIANDWEPYSYEIARGTVALNHQPAFAELGGAPAVFEHLNALPGHIGYVAKHLCPANDETADPTRERMFFTQANGRRIDAIREQIEQWQRGDQISPDERAYLLAALLYAVSYVSNTSGLFKAYHHGWGGRTGTALYRILSRLTLTPPLLLDNGAGNLACRQDAGELADRLTDVAGGRPDVVYLDPPYNQHPYGSNYHLLNTVALWDKPPIDPRVIIDGKCVNKAAIRTDWRTERRSPYNHARKALSAFEEMIDRLDARWLIVSYSTDGNIALEDMLAVLARRGALHVITETYKRYRVSTPRMSAKSHNVEFAAAVNLGARSSRVDVSAMADSIRSQERSALVAAS